MSEKEKQILDEIAEKLPKVSEQNKAYIKGYMDGCINTAQTNAHSDKSENE